VNGMGDWWIEKEMETMKRFDSTTPKYIVLFKATTILTNFLHGH
jgi:hypothetical protein